MAEDRPTQQPPAPEAQGRRPPAGRDVIRAFAVGLFATAVLVSGKVAMEHTAFGRRLELLAYEFLHRRLSPFDPSRPLPVVVLDTSGMKGGKDGAATSREELSKLIDSLLTAEPRGIAIDMNFSPSRKSGLDGEDDFEFFAGLKERGQRWGVPVFVGVSREAAGAGDAELWLGAREYGEMAAFMDINDEDTTRLPYSIKCGGDELFSFAAALARRVSRPHGPPAFFGPLLKDVKMEGERCGERCSCSYLLANYSKLEVIQAQSLPIITPDAVKNAEDKFHDRVVILGDGKLERAQDPFVVVSRNRPVPGVFLHAAAFYTLSDEPLYQFTHTGRIAVDFAIALLILSGLAVIQWRNLHNTQFSRHRLESIFITLAVVGVLVGGVLLIRFLHVVWLDFVLVVAALLLHPSAEKWVERVWAYVTRHRAAAHKAPAA